MKVGMMLPCFHPVKLVEMAVELAQSAGVDSLWTLDHLLGPFAPQLWSEIPMSQVVPDPDAFLDPFVLSAWLGRVTDLPLGVAVTDGIRRGHADIARASLSLQNLCQGGFNLGIGSGEKENLTPFGYPFDRSVSRLEGFLAALDHLFTTGRMPEGVGRLGYPVAIAGGRPRIWVAGHRPRMLKLTGRYADGWIPFEVTDAREYASMKATIAQHAAEASRPEPESALVVFTVLGESRDRMLELFEAAPMAKSLALVTTTAQDWQALGYRHPLGDTSRGYQNFLPHEVDVDTLKTITPRIPMEMVERRMFIGNADEVAAKLFPYQRAGCEHIVILNFAGLAGGLDNVEVSGQETITLTRLLHGAGSD